VRLIGSSTRYLQLGESAATQPPLLLSVVFVAKDSAKMTRRYNLHRFCVLPLILCESGT